MGAILRAAEAVAALALAGLVAVVAGAILGRIAYDLSGGALDLLLPGAIELARYALFVLVLSALPGALAAGLVRVEILAERFPPAIGRALERLWALAAAAIGGVAAWRFGARALREAEGGLVSQDLGLPLWPLSAYAAAALALFALTGLALAIRGRA
jgi:TRAP-type C4-dicarboxylate transport system permease small subunit